MLTEFFEFNKQEPIANDVRVETQEECERRQPLRQVKYIDFPRYCAWQHVQSYWKLRVRGPEDPNGLCATDAVGRIPLIVGVKELYASASCDRCNIV